MNFKYDNESNPLRSTMLVGRLAVGNFPESLSLGARPASVPVLRSDGTKHGLTSLLAK